MAPDVGGAHSRLEAAKLGVCATFVAVIVTAAAAAPLAGGVDVQQLGQLAVSLGEEREQV